MVALGVVAASFDLTKGDSRYAVVLLSIVGALVSVLQTVRDYGSQAAAHRTAARQYGALRREIEEAALLQDLGEAKQLTIRMDELRRRWDWTASLAPNAPKRIRRQADSREYEKHFT